MRRKKRLSLRSNQARKKQQKPNAIGRGGALLRPMGSYKSVQHSVGADDSVGPKNVANSPKISVKTVRSAGGQSRPPLRWNTQVRSNLPRFSAEQLPSAGRSRAPPLPTASRFTIVTQNKRTMHHRRRGFINHNHRPCRWFAQAPLGPITSRTYRFIESSFYCMMRPTAIEMAAWRILLFVSPWLSVFLNHTLSPAFQTCSSLRSDIFSGHS